MKSIDDLLQAILRLAPIPVYIVIGYAFFVFKNLKGELRIFAWFLFLSGIIQAISHVLWFNSKNNLPLLAIYIVAGYGCLAWFYVNVMKGFINPKIIWGSAIGLAIFTIANSVFFQGIFIFPSNSLSVECVLVIILSLSTYIFLLDDMVKKKKAHLVASLNWINAGLFIYYTSNLLLFYFGEFFMKFYVELNRYTWTLHTFFLIVMYSCFFVGLWKRPSS
jgi:hypothetical protein